MSTAPSHVLDHSSRLMLANQAKAKPKSKRGAPPKRSVPKPSVPAPERPPETPSDSS